jgi:hypothetical protein
MRAGKKASEFNESKLVQILQEGQRMENVLRKHRNVVVVERPEEKTKH